MRLRNKTSVLRVAPCSYVHQSLNCSRHSVFAEDLLSPNLLWLHTSGITCCQWSPYQYKSALKGEVPCGSESRLLPKSFLNFGLATSTLPAWSKSLLQSVSSAVKLVLTPLLPYSIFFFLARYIHFAALFQLACFLPFGSSVCDIFSFSFLAQDCTRDVVLLMGNLFV